MTDTPTQSVYPELVARYRNARQWYRLHAEADEDEQTYCRRFVADLGPIVTQSSTVSMANIAWLEGAAYDESGLHL